jgi:hypothetical protein
MGHGTGRPDLFDTGPVGTAPGYLDPVRGIERIDHGLVAGTQVGVDEDETNHRGNGARPLMNTKRLTAMRF